MRRLAILAFAIGGMLAVSCEASPLRLEHGGMTAKVTAVMLEATRQLPPETKALSWSDLPMGDDHDEPEGSGDEDPAEQDRLDPAAIDAMKQRWRDVLEGGAILSGGEESTWSAFETTEPEQEDADDEDVAQGGETEIGAAEDAAIADEELLDPAWVEEELARLNERILQLEMQVEQQREELDTLALAMTIQSQRVRILDAAMTQLLLVGGR